MVLIDIVLFWRFRLILHSTRRGGFRLNRAKSNKRPSYTVYMHGPSDFMAVRIAIARLDILHILVAVFEPGQTLRSV